MLQYKIPQNVEVEDTIIGPITMKQLAILGGGGGMAYVIYISLAKSYYPEVWLPPVAFISLMTICIAFVEIKNIKFVKWVLLMMEAMLLPPQRVWDKRQSTQFLFRYSGPTKTPQKKEEKLDPSLKKAQQVSNLDEITKALNMSNFLDEKEETPLGKTADHDLAATALTDTERDRHEERLQNLPPEKKTSAIRSDGLPLNFEKVNTDELRNISTPS